MNHRRVSLALVLALLFLLTFQAAGAEKPLRLQGVPSPLAGSLSTTFTYQGSLTDGGKPANGSYDFRFRLYDALSGGSQVGPTVEVGDIGVVKGLFSAQLDFGAVFSGNALWLEVGVRPGAGTGDYTALSPRQPLTAAPYALYSADGPFWSLQGNTATDPAQDYLGTSDWVTLTLAVSGTAALRIVPANNNTWGYSPNLIGGYSGNEVGSGIVGATIAGGGRVTTPNKAMGDFSTVSGGYANTANGWSATVGGGYNNTASGGTATVGGGYSNTTSGSFSTVGGGFGNTASNSYATVGGGLGNTASDWYATVGGGDWNTASGDESTVGGGWNNIASGLKATVPGGDANEASGDYSFAAGRLAIADHTGSFVWADSTEEDFNSTTTNQFRVRATNGAEFIAENTAYGFRAENLSDGDGIRGVANTSIGNLWAAVYAWNNGTSPGVYASTAGTYSGYFMDQIYVDGGCVGCTLIYIAQNSGSQPLEPGDLLAAAGLGSPLVGSSAPILQVSLASPSEPGAIGVALARAAIVQSSKDGLTSESAERAEGLVQPGEYLFVVVQGIAQLKVEASTAPIVPGTRLTPADRPGHARPLRSQLIEGMPVAEGAPVVAIALGSLEQGTGLLPVLVSLR